MNHLLVYREYPPTPGGGIGTYAHHAAHALAAAGERVHVIAQRWPGADVVREDAHEGRLTVHRLPFTAPRGLRGVRPHPRLPAGLPRDLMRTDAPAQAFGYQVANLAEALIRTEAIDVIEAPEYDAPLYQFQLRRALGLGPSQEPPCIIHLHSPTEFIARANGWDRWSGHAPTTERLETYSIVAADYLLSPSQYLATQVERRFDFDEKSVTVIPYPLGSVEPIDRAPDVWTTGSVLYIGRLELRKGILEWIDAAVRIAQSHPDVRFDFAGSDHVDAQLGEFGHLNARIPAAVRSRFVFHDHCDRGTLTRLLAQSRLAVVPSRWENLPYTCIEAMASGLPVMASPEGGMSELIDPRNSGWIAAGTAPHDLVRAAEEALAAGPAGLQRAGQCAAQAVRRQCNDDVVVAHRLEFANRVVRGGVRRSRCVSAHLPRRGRPADRRRSSAEFPGADTTARGIACAIVVTSDDSATEATRRSLANQNLDPPVSISLVADTTAARNEWLQSIGVDAVSASVPTSAPMAVAFIDAGAQLAPDFFARCAAVLAREPRVGIVSPWYRLGSDRGALVGRPCAAFPYQWRQDDVGRSAVFRAEALRAAGGLRAGFDPGLALWDMANAVLMSGWLAVSYPEILAVLPPARVGSQAATRDLLERFPDEVANDPIELWMLTTNRTGRSPFSTHSALGATAAVVRHPLQATRYIARRVTARWRRRAQ